MKKNTFNSKCVFLQMPVTLTVFKVALGSPAAYLIYLLNLLSWTRHLKSPTAIYLDQVFLGWKRNYSFQWLEMTNQDLKSSKLCSYLGKEHACWGTTDYPECSRNQEETKVDRENEREKWAESCDQSIWDLVVRQWLSDVTHLPSQNPWATSASWGGLCESIRPSELRQTCKCPYHSPLSEVGTQNTALSSRSLHSGLFQY